MPSLDPYHDLLGAIRLDDWATQAACKGKPEVLEQGGPDARALCDNCPVIQQCTDWLFSLDPRADPGFFSAGMTHAERNTARRRRAHIKRRQQTATKPAAKPRPKPRPKPAAKAKPAETIPDGMKRCSKCRAVKDLSGFYIERRTADGHAGVCITCKRIANAAAAARRRAANAAAAEARRRRSDAAYAHQTRRPRQKAAA